MSSANAFNLDNYKFLSASKEVLIPDKKLFWQKEYL